MKSEITTAGIPEERVATILARAAELDRNTLETVSVDALRAAALDAGISPAAMDAALEEYAAGQVMPAPAGDDGDRPKPRFARVRGLFRRLTGPLKLTGLMFLIGLTGAAGEGAVAIGWGIGLWLAGAMMVKHRPTRRARGFILRLVLMVLGLALGSAIGEVDEDAIAGLFIVGAPLLVFGTAFIKVRLPKRFRREAIDEQLLAKLGSH